jgi:chromosome segregation ATPase
MFLEVVTFLMLILVLVLKYGAVTRIVQLNQRLRDAEGKCRRNEERLKVQLAQRRVAEKEETGLERQQVTLENETERIEEELSGLKRSNMESLQQLAKSRGLSRPLEN